METGNVTTEDLIEPGYPKSLSSAWEVTGSIDAVIQRPNGKIYIFQGDQYYRFDDKLLTTGVDTMPVKPDSGYPKSITENYRGLPINLDSGYSAVNGYLYFFKGTKYYRIRDKHAFPDENLEDFVEGCYPKDISTSFLSWPSNSAVLASFQRSTNQEIYFFDNSGGNSLYYKYQDPYLMTSYPDRAQSNYPQSISSKWLPSSCNSGNQAGAVSTPVDATFQRLNGKIYFFSGSNYWRFSDKYIINYTSSPPGNDCADPGYPKLISDEFSGFPASTSVDAVVQRSNGLIYFFTGDSYYRFTDKYVSGKSKDEADAGYPKKIAANFIGVPDNVDSAFFRSAVNAIYFFKGTNYYRVPDKYYFSLDTDTVSSGYPKDIDSNWIDTSQTGAKTVRSVTAAFYRSNGFIYTFSGDRYYKFVEKYLDTGAPCTSLSEPQIDQLETDLAVSQNRVSALQAQLAIYEARYNSTNSSVLASSPFSLLILALSALVTFLYC